MITLRNNNPLTLACLPLAVVLSCGAGRAHAAEYVEWGEQMNVVVCGMEAVRDIHECRPLREHTPEYQAAKVRYKDGTVRVERVVGFIYVGCNPNGLCSAIHTRPGVTQGEYVGEIAPAPKPSYYTLAYGWYMSVDADGNPTAYRQGIGPAYNMEPYADGYARDADGNEIPIAHEWED